MQISIQKTVTNLNSNKQNTTVPQTVAYGDPSVNMWFPHDLAQGDLNPAFIFFQFFKYSRPSIYNPPSLQPLGTVAFPMPVDLVDRVSLTYDQRGSGAALGAALDHASVPAGSGPAATLAALASGVTTIGEGVGLSGLETILDHTPIVKGEDFIPKGLQFMGLAQNPFLSILFNAPQFKRFGMTWTFIPETPQDSVNLDYIVRKFKYHSLPSFSMGGLFLTYPDVVVPTIFPQNYFFNFKRCVLENVIVNYVPGRTPAVYAGTLAPTAVQFSISLLEIELWFKDDLQAQGSGSGTPQSYQTNAPSGVNPGGSTPTPVPGSPTLQGGGTPKNDPLVSGVTIDPNGPNEFGK